jgi:hypothetical protein
MPIACARVGTILDLDPGRRLGIWRARVLRDDPFEVALAGLRRRARARRAVKMRDRGLRDRGRPRDFINSTAARMTYIIAAAIVGIL